MEGMTREQIEVVAALDLEGELDLEGQNVNHSFECQSLNRSDSLVWERENGTQRFPTYSVDNGIVLNMSSVDLTDLDIYICRDMLSGDEISINITGGLYHT